MPVLLITGATGLCLLMLYGCLVYTNTGQHKLSIFNAWISPGVNRSMYLGGGGLFVISSLIILMGIVISNAFGLTWDFSRPAADIAIYYVCMSFFFIGLPLLLLGMRMPPASTDDTGKETRKSFQLLGTILIIGALGTCVASTIHYLFVY